MWTYMTTGTYHFLEKIISNNPRISFHLMRSGATTLVLYESKEKKSLFAAGRKFQHLHSFDTLRQFGFVAMEHIPVLKEAVPVFEEKFSAHWNSLEETAQLMSARLMKEHRKNNYMLLTQWINQKDYDKWKKEIAAKESFFSNMTRQSAYIANRPFTNTYHIVVDD